MHSVATLIRRQNYTCGSEGLDNVCETNSSECVKEICASCSGYVEIANCCALSSWGAMAECVVNLMNDPDTLTETVSSTSTAAQSALTTTTEGGFNACLSVEEMLTSCESKSGAFSTAMFSQQASCLCYANDTFQPTVYDRLYSNCMGYMSTADPGGYANITAAATTSIDLSPCGHLGLSTTSTATTTWTHYIGTTPSTLMGPTRTSTSTSTSIITATDSNTMNLSVSTYTGAAVTEIPVSVSYRLTP
ncbi:hypothetical protein LTS07_001807 [Exophiala sideris]|uniref:Extracellular membrane protein CFEM domain-containing protein n=1 Tax=Exophiala sideris TaxID=1016849 RepID=A0ABR0JPC3_9EURO|nr:hypothetical protein LTS07_001807 [Exophiala sideris]KAK5044321.1 hypothetical protein LTR13_000677 [Exophiala sideris]KAK5067821.1 hypothetical protein LTR69_001810 [Exophiala sideris]KAK5183937.1 hypothetical protein LTR44_003442 [Eurotiomycetes sp. CCFEE 6388]